MNVHVLSVGTATPAASYSQKEMLSFVLERFNIRERTRQLYSKVLTHPSIERRSFALADLDDALDQHLDRKNARFETEAPRLGVLALNDALARANLSPSAVAYVAAATCTGYVCPGLSSHIVERAGLNPGVRVADLVGMGCGAALPAMEQAANFARSNPGNVAAVVCSEICSATLVSNDDPDIVISNALFADGAAAVLLRCDTGGGGLTIRNFSARTFPRWRDELRFVSENGHLKNTLGKNVPLHAAHAVRQAIDELAPTGSIAHWVFHAGGQRVIDALAAEFKLADRDVACSRTVLKNHGNMSSPTVLFVLQETLRTHSFSVGDRIAMASFGAGFSAYGALLEWI